MLAGLAQCVGEAPVVAAELRHVSNASASGNVRVKALDSALAKTSMYEDKAVRET